MNNKLICLTNLPEDNRIKFADKINNRLDIEIYYGKVNADTGIFLKDKVTQKRFFHIQGYIMGYINAYGYGCEITE